MSAATCNSPERLSLGAYVVGALDPVDRAAMEAHLAGCPACRDELAELAVLPALLSRVPVEDVLASTPAPPPGAARQLVARARASRRARRRRAAIAAGTVALAALAAAAVVVLPRDEAPDRPPSATASVTSARPGVSASFRLRPTAWGTAVRVHLRGVRAGTHCRLVARGRDGRREVAGAWRATYEGATHVSAATAIPAYDLASLEVVTRSGQRLVRAGVDG